MVTVKSQRYGRRRVPPRTRETIKGDLIQRKKHLEGFIPLYERVFDLLFQTILDRTQDLGTKVQRVRYFPNSRVMEIGVAWNRDADYSRAFGVFCLWRNGIFHNNDIQKWPKVEIRATDWPTIETMSDDQVVERILTTIGAPWVSRFAVRPEAGAFSHDIRSLQTTIRNMRAITPLKHAREIADLAARIDSLSNIT